MLAGTVLLTLQGNRGVPGGGGLYTVLGLVLLVLNIYVTIRVLQSHKTLLVKIVWILFVWIVPLIGLVAYFLLGREKR